MADPRDSATPSEADARELRPCWTCRGRTFAEISHSSQEHGWPLFRCVNCKAIYPAHALATLPPQDRSGDARELLDAEVAKQPAEIDLLDNPPPIVTEEAALRAIEAALSLSQDRSEGVGELREALQFYADFHANSAVGERARTALGSQSASTPEGERP